MPITMPSTLFFKVSYLITISSGALHYTVIQQWNAYVCSKIPGILHMKVSLISHTERNIQCLHMAMFTMTANYMQKVGICKKRSSGCRQTARSKGAKTLSSPFEKKNLVLSLLQVSDLADATFMTCKKAAVSHFEMHTKKLLKLFNVYQQWHSKEKQWKSISGLLRASFKLDMVRNLLKQTH